MTAIVRVLVCVNCGKDCIFYRKMSVAQAESVHKFFVEHRRCELVNVPEELRVA